MIKILGLAIVGLATIAPPSTDTMCYAAYNSGLLGKVCDGIKTTFATTGAAVTRCSADVNAIMTAAGVNVDGSGTHSMAEACGLWSPSDCITQYCCGGPAGTDCTFFGPGSDANSQCNSANFLTDYVYMGDAANAANPPADITKNRCYGQTSGGGGTVMTSCTYEMKTVDPVTGATSTQNVSGYMVGGTCYPFGTPYYYNYPYSSYGWYYPMNYYYYGASSYGTYYDFYGYGYTGYYYPYYGYYGQNGYGMYDWVGTSTCQWCGYGYGWESLGYWGGYYGWYGGYYFNTMFKSKEQFHKLKQQEEEAKISPPMMLTQTLLQTIAKDVQA